MRILIHDNELRGNSVSSSQLQHGSRYSFMSSIRTQIKFILEVLGNESHSMDMLELAADERTVGIEKRSMNL